MRIRRWAIASGQIGALHDPKAWLGAAAGRQAQCLCFYIYISLFLTRKMEEALTTLNMTD